MLTNENQVTCIEPTEATASAVRLANIEYRIATHMRGACENILEVGRCLVDAKDSGLVPHGHWETWVRDNAHVTERYAQKLMQIARSVERGSMMSNLPISKIQALLSLPEPAREPLATKAVQDDMTLRDLQAEVKRLSNRARTAEVKLRVAGRQTPAPAEGISQEAQEIINRLKTELAEAETYAEDQADLRQEAQRELLNQQAQAVRGGRVSSSSMSTTELAAAVRAFMGAAGVLPHMGVDVAGLADGEKQQLNQYVEMIAAWVEGSRRALGTVMIYADQEG